MICKTQLDNALQSYASLNVTAEEVFKAESPAGLINYHVQVCQTRSWSRPSCQQIKYQLVGLIPRTRSAYLSHIAQSSQQTMGNLQKIGPFFVQILSTFES